MQYQLFVVDAHKGDNVLFIIISAPNIMYGTY